MDTSLDDVISSKRSSRGRGGGRGRGRGAGRGAGRATRGSSRYSPYGGRGGGRGGRGGGGGGGRASVPIMVTNLDSQVIDQDIQELFGEVGPVKVARMLYTRGGQCTGSAEVVYTNQNNAQKAFDKYNGVMLDNKPMRIFFLTKPVREPATNRLKTPPGAAQNKPKPKAEKPKKEPKKPKTAEELDAEMDSFFSKTDEPEAEAAAQPEAADAAAPAKEEAAAAEEEPAAAEAAEPAE